MIRPSTSRCASRVPCFLDEHQLGNRFVQPPLLGDMRLVVAVDLDPVGQMERLQADGEEF